MARRSEHTQEQLKEMVFQAAETIIKEEGLSALKVRKIAMDIGYTVGSVYMVFENLDDLITHINANTLDNLALQLDQALLNTDSKKDIRALAMAYLQFASDNFNLWHTLFIHRQPDDTAIPEWYQDKVDALFLRVENLFHNLAPDKADGEIRQAARALWSGIHGICILSLSDSRSVVNLEDIEATVLTLVDCFILGWIPSTR